MVEKKKKNGEKNENNRGSGMVIGKWNSGNYYNINNKEEGRKI